MTVTQVDKLFSRKPDKDHPFGHERLESITSIILAMSLGATALILGYQGILAIIDFLNYICLIKKNLF